MVNSSFGNNENSAIARKCAWAVRSRCNRVSLYIYKLAEREGERDRQIETETERQKESHRETDRGGERERETERERQRETETDRDRQRRRETDTETASQTDRQMRLPGFQPVSKGNSGNVAVMMHFRVYPSLSRAHVLHNYHIIRYPALS